MFARNEWAIFSDEDRLFFCRRFTLMFADQTRSAFICVISGEDFVLCERFSTFIVTMRMEPMLILQ